MAAEELDKIITKIAMRTADTINTKIANADAEEISTAGPAAGARIASTARAAAPTVLPRPSNGSPSLSGWQPVTSGESLVEYDEGNVILLVAEQ